MTVSAVQRGKLTKQSMKHIAKLPEARRPEVIFLESVASWLTWKKHREWVKELSRKLKKLRYKTSWRTMNTAEHGVVQWRRRAIGVCLLKPSTVKRFRWPEAVRLKHGVGSMRMPLNEKYDAPYAWPGSSRLKPGSRGMGTSSKGRRRMRSLVKKSILKLKSQGRWRRDGSSVMVDVDSSFCCGRVCKRVMHTLTATRSAAGGPWLLNNGRRMKVQELAVLQEIDWEQIKHGVLKAPTDFTDQFRAGRLGTRPVPTSSSESFRELCGL